MAEVVAESGQDISTRLWAWLVVDWK